MILIYACAYTGVIAVPIDASRFVHELELMLDKTKPRGLVLMTSFDGVDYANQFRRAMMTTNNSFSLHLHHIILVKRFVNFELESGVYEQDLDYDDERISDYDDVFGTDGHSICHCQLPQTSSHDPFIILFTVRLFSRPISEF